MYNDEDEFDDGDFIFNEYTIDDSLDSLSRLEKYFNSDFSLQRLVLVRDIFDTAREAVEDRLLASFDRIRSSYRNGLSVVPIERESCGGCFNTIPPQRQSEIKQHKKIIVCENCGRILVDADLNDTVEP